MIESAVVGLGMFGGPGAPVLLAITFRDGKIPAAYAQAIPTPPAAAVLNSLASALIRVA